MKRSVFGVAMAMALVATAANAQSLVPAAKPISFGIAGGMSMPTGDFGDAFKSGYNVSGMLQFELPASPFAIRVEGQFQNFDGKDVLEGVNSKSIGGLANALYYFPTSSIVRPYVTGGLGFFHLKMDASDICEDLPLDDDECSSSENKFGFDLGAGLEFRLTGISTFIEANWQSVQTEGSASRMFPIRVGIKF